MRERSTVSRCKSIARSCRRYLWIGGRRSRCCIQTPRVAISHQAVERGKSGARCILALCANQASPLIHQVDRRGCSHFPHHLASVRLDRDLSDAQINGNIGFRLRQRRTADLDELLGKPAALVPAIELAQAGRSDHMRTCAGSPMAGCIAAAPGYAGLLRAGQLLQRRGRCWRA